MLIEYDPKEIRRRREGLTYSGELLAHLSRTTASTVYALERGERRRINEKLVESLAHALGCQPTDIAPSYVPPSIPFVRRARYDRQMLKNRRAELGLTLEEVGRRAGLSLEAIARLEGKDTCRPETIRRVAKALGLRLHDVAPIFTQSIALARGQSAALEPSGVEVPRSRATA
jgi:transcriptional regulator with XRE-family HTH domain